MKKENNLISIRIVSQEELFNLIISVNRHMTCANLMTYMSQEIKNRYPDFSSDNYYFLHNGQKLIFNARSLKSENFQDGDIILVCRIEDDNFIYDLDCISIADIGEPISINLISHDHNFNFKLVIDSELTGTELIKALTEKIIEKYPEKSKNQFYFLYNGKKLDFTSKTVESLGIKEGDTFLAFEIKPLLDENLELEVSVLIDESNKHEINLDFKLKGLLKFCLIKDMSLIIDKNLELYRPKLNKKMKHILEIISGGNIDLNQTENSIMSMLKKFEGINILNFSKFIDAFINREELLETFNIFNEEEKILIQKENDCLSSYSEYMKKFEEDFEKARKKVYLNGE